MSPTPLALALAFSIGTATPEVVPELTVRALCQGERVVGLAVRTNAAGTWRIVFPPDNPCEGNEPEQPQPPTGKAT